MSRDPPSICDQLRRCSCWTNSRQTASFRQLPSERKRKRRRTTRRAGYW